MYVNVTNVGGGEGGGEIERGGKDSDIRVTTTVNYP